MHESRKRMIGIMASILAARKLAQHVGSRVEKEIVRGTRTFVIQEIPYLIASLNQTGKDLRT